MLVELFSLDGDAPFKVEKQALGVGIGDNMQLYKGVRTWYD